MAFLPTAVAQYAAVTPVDNTALVNGPAQRFYCTGGGTLACKSGDGSSITITAAANAWTPLFYYAIAVVMATGTTATGITAEGWSAPTTTGIKP